MATPNIVPRADSEGGLGTASKYWASAYIDTIFTTGSVTVGGPTSTRLEVTLTENDKVDLKSVDGSTTARKLTFSTGGTTALTLDTSQDATFAGKITTGNQINVLGVQTGSDGAFGEIIFHNNSDSVATIASFRDGADTSGSLVFQTQNAGSFATALTLAANNNATFAGTVAGTSFNSIPFHANTNSSSMYTHDVSGQTNTAQYNTAYGFLAMDAITTGDQNVAIGYNAGGAISTASGNVAIGHEALKLEDTHGYNVAVGFAALKNQNSSGVGYNVGIGYAAAEIGVSGLYNVAIGGEALYINQDGDANTAVGYKAMKRFEADTDGHGENTAFGAYAMKGDDTTPGTSTGTQNTAIGAYAMGNSVLTGDSNTAVGYQAGKVLTSGVQNTIIGGLAGDALTTGDNNIIIGYNAAASAVGVNNEVTLGNTSIDTLRCGTNTITSISDGRDKTDVKDSSYGLEFINTIRPVEFTWDFRPENMAENKQGRKRVGFIAQELQEAMPNGENEILDLVYESNPERLEAKYGKLIPILVKAVQELSEEVKALKNK